MSLPENSTLYFDPDDVNVEAQLVELTPDLLAREIAAEWWMDPEIRDDLAPTAIDRHWDWFKTPDLDGTPLECKRVAIVTGDGRVQGAMIISSEPVRSDLEENQGCLFVDQLCTAPRNRPMLRKDGMKWFKGVGSQLLQWGCRLSLELHCNGKLWLLASPEGLSTYQWLGFKQLNLAPVLYDGIEYRPMELPIAGVPLLLSK